MELAQQQRKGWLLACTVEQRLALFGVITAWARDIGGRTDLAPLESREMYRVFADELIKLGRDEHGTELTADLHLRRQWSRLGISSKAHWVSGAGQWLPADSPGGYASRVINSSLVPPHFETLYPIQQRNLLGQVAREIEGYLQRDPARYGSRVEEYQRLATAARWVQQRGDNQLNTCLRWDHMDNPQRAIVLAHVCGFAKRAYAPKRLDPECRANLQALAVTAERVSAHLWPRNLER